MEDLRAQGEGAQEADDERRGTQLERPCREHRAAGAGSDQLGGCPFRVGGAEGGAKPRAASPALAGAAQRQGRRSRERRGAAGNRFARAENRRGRGDTADRVEGSLCSRMQDSSLA